MINKKIIYHILGTLLFIETLLLIVCCIVSLVYGEDDLPSFGITTAISAALGFIFKLMGRNAGGNMTRRDSYVVVSSTWVIFTLVGMLPFIISGYIPSVTDAFFETMSGFTTTGASILNNIESLPHGLLFWRALTQWIGGLGIVSFTVALLPSLKGTGLMLFSAESTGPLHDKLQPRVSTTAKWIWGVYFTITIVTIAALVVEGMSIFDSVCHSFAATSTGGFSTKQDSIGAYHSAAIEYTLAISMFVSAVNFSLIYLCFKRKSVRYLFRDTEFKTFFLSCAIITGICTVGIMTQHVCGWEQAFRKALFQVVSVHSTTGLVSDDYMKWPAYTLLPLLLAMLFGGSSGSTAGAIKCVRVSMLVKVAKNELNHILHPNAVLPVRVGSHVIESGTRTSLLAFFTLYLAIAGLSWFAFMLMGVGFLEGISLTLSSMGGVGPAMGVFGPAFSWAALPAEGKWLCSFLMLAGRLEIFPLLLICYPNFWKDR
jgi:trk system potassium uptake protein TrkH